MADEVQESEDLLNLDSRDDEGMVVAPPSRAGRNPMMASRNHCIASTDLPEVEGVVAPMKSLVRPRPVTEPVISYPPAWEAAQPAVLPHDSQDTLDVSRPTEGTPHTPMIRTLTVRCEGRWRVRNFPSLNSKVIGSIASGTIVMAEDVEEDRDEDPRQLPAINPVTGFVQDPVGLSIPSEDVSGEEVSSHLKSLWVLVHSFKPQEAGGVSEMKHDVATGGAMYCLRRNALGYGLYEPGVEPLDGPLVQLPGALAADLRADAQQAHVEKNEDVSLTWKLLGAADVVHRLWSSLGLDSQDAVAGKSMQWGSRRSAAEAFEVKQREQLKKAAASLKDVTARLAATADSPNSEEDITAGLSKDARTQFAKLRIALHSAVTSKSDVDDAEEETPGEEVLARGSPKELQQFCEQLTRVERQTSWPELSYELKKDIVSFSWKYLADLETYVRSEAKMKRVMQMPNIPAVVAAPLAAEQPKSNPVAEANLLGFISDIDSGDLLENDIDQAQVGAAGQPTAQKL